MADQKNIKDESPKSDKQPLPAVEGAEKVSETDLDDRRAVSP